MKSVKPVLPVFIIFLLASCVTNKKLTYLQSQETFIDSIVSVQPEDYKLQPFDNLYIRIVTPDPQWSEMFNTLPVYASSGNVTELSANLISYSVDASGTIELPYAGKFSVAGKTMAEVKSDLENALRSYITDAAVTVRLINNYISLVGEVKQPGRYPVYKDRMTIFQALAMAGDLGDFSDRQKMKIIRQTQNGSIVKEFNLNDRSILTSEFYYVMPNDVIYAQPARGRFFQMNAFPYSVILSTITTFILILNFIE